FVLLDDEVAAPFKHRIERDALGFLQYTARQRVDSFFFSSRRRHTRFKCDWSSDVCSSDLMLASANWSTSMWLARSSSACARRLTVSLVIATDSGGWAATLAASAIAASKAWPGSATSSTRPHWCASAAVMRWSA